MDEELEALFREAISTPNAKEVLRRLRGVYEKNWHRSGGVELTWKGTPQGVFSEYLHASGARKLVRDPTAIPLTCEEI